MPPLLTTVHIFDIDQATLAETYRSTADVAALGDGLAVALAELTATGQTLVGGGAAPLTRLVRAEPADDRWLSQPDVQTMLRRADTASGLERIAKCRRWFKGFGTTGAVHHVGRAYERRAVRQASDFVSGLSDVVPGEQMP